ncbi:MAG: response regulator [Fimbriimonadales bacterium]|nr:response regulator [Fimbriimonadales bacterium]
MNEHPESVITSLNSIRALLPKDSTAAGKFLRSHSFCTSRAQFEGKTSDQNSHIAAVAGNSAVGHEGTVLVIEDDEDLRAIYSEALRASGLDVLTAQDTFQAFELAQLHSNDVRLIVSDVMLPGANGYELTRRLRAAIPGVKALFVTGQSMDKLHALGFDSSREHVLAKPFGPQRLVALVHEVLSSRCGKLS